MPMVARFEKNDYNSHFNTGSLMKLKPGVGVAL